MYDDDDRPVVFGTAAGRSWFVPHVEAEDDDYELDDVGDGDYGDYGDHEHDRDGDGRAADDQAPPTEFIPAVGTVDPADLHLHSDGDADGDFEPDHEPVAFSDDAVPVAARGRGRRVTTIGTRVLVTLLSAAVMAATGVVWLRVVQFEDSKNTTDALAQAQAQAGAPSADDGAQDILIVGSDTRTDLQGHPLSDRILRELRTEANDATNTDTLILLRLPRNGGRAYAISIPRDTYVDVPGYRMSKINSAFGATQYLTAQRLVAGGEKDRAKINRESDDAGRAALIQTVQNLTGVRIDHYAEVSLYGFYLLTEALDGVDVCLKHATSDKDSGANFRAGPQTVRGSDAVSFVRQRENLPRGDLDRIVRQQTFLSSAMNKVLSSGTLTDNAKLGALQDAVSKTVVMDPGLKFFDLVNEAQSMAAGKIEFATIPVTAVGARNDRGESVITVDVPAVKAFVANLVSSTAPPKFAGNRLLDLGTPVAVKFAYAVPCID